MSRVIKFRVHCKDTGKILAYEQFNTCLNWGYYWVDASIPEEDRICKTLDYFKHPHPLGTVARVQFTGLHDVNGVEIYESDIVEVHYFDPMGKLHSDTPDFTTDVVFGRGCFLIHSSYLRTERCTIDNLIESKDGSYVSNYGNIREWGKCYLKVIGNIHQNP